MYKLPFLKKLKTSYCLVVIATIGLVTACSRNPAEQDKPKTSSNADSAETVSTPRVTLIASPLDEVEQSSHLFWVNEDEILFYPKGAGLDSVAKILNVKTQKIRSSEANIWYRGCKGGSSVRQANPYSKIEDDQILRAIQGSECAIAMYPPSRDQSTYWASFSLLANDGYVTLPAAESDAVLHKSDNTLVPLQGLNAKRLYGVNEHLVFYPHKGAYLLHNTHPKEVFWLYPDGKLESIPIKPLDVPGNAMIFATKSGFIQNHYQWPKWRFVLLGSETVDIEQHPVWGVAVNPDGCKVAYKTTEDVKTNIVTLKVIDVCH